EPEEVELVARRVDDAHTVVDGGGDVVVAFRVEAEAVAPATSELLDDPLAFPVGQQPLQPAPFDHDQRAVAVECDAVAVREAVGADAKPAVALVRHDPAAGPGGGRGRRWAGEGHGSVAADGAVGGRLRAGA